MKTITLILLSWFTLTTTSPSNYICKNARVSIFSKAPLEDIDASTTKAVSVLNVTTGDLAFSVPIKSLTFQKSLMQEHFNESYLESDKFPQAVFKGKLQEKIDYTKDGSFPVNVTGTLEVHGVKQNRTITGRISITGGVLTMTSSFIVLCKDHNIEIPKLVFQKIAESIQVQVSATYASIN